MDNPFLIPEKVVYYSMNQRNAKKLENIYQITKIIPKIR